MSPLATPSRTRIAAAFAAVYVIWGSTYLAIRTCVATMPPFLMVGARFLVAGASLFAAARLSGAALPTAAHWRRSLPVGALMIVLGNGLVVWSEQRVPSSIAALLIAMAPVWFALLAWIFRGERPAPRALAGIAVGLAGIALLVGPGASASGSPAGVDAAGAIALLVASLSWASGSLAAKALDLPRSTTMASALQLLTGGALALAVGLVSGEHRGLALAHVSTASWLAFAYLVVFGSLVGFTAYAYLVRVVSPSSLSTYAYVNPVVAMVLGATLGGEPLSARTLTAAAVILAGVVLMTAPAHLYRAAIDAICAKWTAMYQSVAMFPYRYAITSHKRALSTERSTR